MTCSTYS